MARMGYSALDLGSTPPCAGFFFVAFSIAERRPHVARQDKPMYQLFPQFYSALKTCNDGLAVFRLVSRDPSLSKTSRSLHDH
jgi:hypothetical protein